MAKQASAPQAQTTATATERPNGKTHEEIGKPILDALLKREFTFTPFLGKEALTLTPGNVMRFLCKPTRSGSICTPEQALRFCMLCKARGLNPWEGDAFIVGYDSKSGPEFNLITAFQAMLKRAEVHPDYDGMENGVTVRRSFVDADGNKTTQIFDLAGEIVDPGDALIGGWSRVHFKNRKIPTYRRVNLSAFDTGSEYSRWGKDKAGMIVKCASSKALRESFPNSLGGMYIAGDFGDEPAPEVEPAKAESLKSRISESYTMPATNGTPAAQAEPQHVDQPAAQTEEMDDAGPIPPVNGKLFADGNPAH